MVVLTDFLGAIIFTLFLADEVVAVTVTPGIIERHASLLRRVVVPTRLFFRAITLYPRQRAVI